MESIITLKYWFTNLPLSCLYKLTWHDFEYKRTGTNNPHSTSQQSSGHFDPFRSFRPISRNTTSFCFSYLTHSLILWYTHHSLLSDLSLSLSRVTGVVRKRWRRPGFSAAVRKTLRPSHFAPPWAQQNPVTHFCR